MEIPKQLVDKVEEQAEPILVSFFNENKEKYNFPAESFSSVIEEALTEAFVDDSVSVKELRSAQVRTRRQKKTRWLDNLKKSNESISLDDKDSPFYLAFVFYNNYPVANFKSIFNADNVQDYIDKTIAAATEWVNDINSYFATFPLLSFIKKERFYKFFLNDVLFMALDIINKQYDGQIKSFFRHRPNILIDTPVFNVKSSKVPLTTSTNGQLLANFVTGNGTLMVQVDGMKLVGSDSFKALDARDEAIISSLVANTGKDFYTSKTIIVDLGTLLRSAYNTKTPSARAYKDVLDRLHRMANVRYTYEEKDKGKYTFGVLDTVQDQVIDGKHTILVTLSQRLYDEIIKQNTTKVTKDSFDKLENPIARLLYPSLQRERIRLTLKKQYVSETDTRLKETYDQLFFARSILMNPRTKAKNAAMIEQALDDFVHFNIAIESYRKINKDNFEILFYALSPAERFDFRIDSEQENIYIIDQKQ